MKNVCLIVLLQFAVYFPGKGQLICVHCFEQNESISPGVNNRISNGSFENTSCTPGWFQDVFCPNSAHYNCDLDSWACTGGDVQSYPSVFDNTLSVIPEGNNAAYFGNGNAFACSENWGDPSCLSVQSCIIPGIPAGYPRSNPGYGDLTGVSLEQTVSGLTIGQTYVLEFWAGGEPLQGLLSGQSIFAVDVGYGKIFLKCNPTGAPGPLTGTRYLVVFNANATDHHIVFTNWGHICADCTELVLDDVSLYTIEELPGSVPDCHTAAHEAEENDNIVLYPNPFSSELIIKTNHPERLEITMVDLVSRQILHQEFINTISINTTMLPAGIYFYEVSSKNGIKKSGKIVKD